MIKLIASDMDGTLLNSELQISQENIDAIRYAESTGVEFVIATGRGRTEAIPALEEAGITCPMITLNGALVFDKTGTPVFSAPIDSSLIETVFDILDEEDIYYEIATENGIYTAKKEQRIENFSAVLAEMMPHLTRKMAIAMAMARLEFFTITTVDNLKTFVNDNRVSVLKIIAFHKEGPLHLSVAAKRLHEFEDLVITSSGANNIEINHKNAQKGIAVARLAQQRQVDLEEVMTIGDNLNDMSMIQVAGVSFAMGNAAPEIKEHAKYLTVTNVESGVGKAIRRAVDEEL